MLEVLAWFAGVSVLLTTVLASVLSYAAFQLFRWREDVPNNGAVTFSVIIPALAPDPTRFRELLADLAAQVKSSGIVIVVLQETSADFEADLLREWSGDAELRVLSLEGIPGKASAVRCAIPHVQTSWSVLLDSDLRLTEVPLAALCEGARGAAASYGVIVSESNGNWPLLDAAVWWDKAVSHGVYRAGRFQSGLWPNLPGQCYAIRTDCLRDIWADELGHLDDLAVTLALAAGREEVRFIPRIVGHETGRTSWSSLYLQRTRWTIGLFQAWRTVWQHGGHGAAIACLLLHAWLYYGVPATALAGLSLFALVKQPILAAACIGVYLVMWSACAFHGAIYLRRIASVQPIPTPPLWTIPFAALAILIVQTLGILFAPGFALFGAMVHRPSKVLLHRR